MKFFNHHKNTLFSINIKKKKQHNRSHAVKQKKCCEDQFFFNLFDKLKQKKLLHHKNTLFSINK